MLEGDQVKFVDEHGVEVPDCPGLLRSLLGFDVSVPNGAAVNVLVQFATSMRAHGRGGTLLVTPVGSSAWRESIAGPVLYAVQPPFAELADLMRRDRDNRLAHEWQDDFRRAVDAMAGLTAVDGATVINDRYELLAFGAKITRRRGSAPVEIVRVTEPVEGLESPRPFPRSSAARGISRPRSSSTTSATQPRSSRRRTDASRFSSGRPARTWCTRIASRPCCCSRMRLPRHPRFLPPRHRAGSEIYALALGRALARRHHVTILCADYDPARAHGEVVASPGRPAGRRDREQLDLRIVRRHVPASGDGRPAAARAARVQPDIVHVHNLLNLSF